ASSTDVIGPITHSVADAELIMEVIAGRDFNDMTNLTDFYKTQTLDKKLKIGVIKELMNQQADKGVRDLTDQYIERLRKKGHTAEEVDLPLADHALAMYYIIVPAEVSSNLARYDGVRYGVRDLEASTISELYGKTRDKGFMPENKRRI